MNEDLNSLWTSVSNKFDVGSFEEFSAKMQTPEERKKFFDGMVAQKVDLGDYNQYEARLGKTTGSAGVTPTGGPDVMELESDDGFSGQPETVGELVSDIIGFDFAKPFVEKAQAVGEFLGLVADDYKYKTKETDKEKPEYHAVKNSLSAIPIFSGPNNPLTNLFAHGISSMGRARTYCYARW